jgi:hypothetical protein
LFDSDTGFSSVLNTTVLGEGVWYWEVTHNLNDTSLMAGVAEGTLPKTSIPGSAGHVSIALDFSTGNVIRSDGTIFTNLVSQYENNIKGMAVGMVYDAVNNVFKVIVNYIAYEFPLHAVPANPGVVIGNGSTTKGIIDAKVNLGQENFFYGVFDGATQIEQYVSEGGGNM